jgi:hypothetical protein
VLPGLSRLSSSDMDSGKATKKRRKQQHYNIHTTIWEQRLPRARSGCRDDTAIVHATAQAQVLLFSKLPLEIRQHIYLYEFCGNQLELRVARDKIEDSKTNPFQLMCPAAQQLLGFLGSCKLAYRSWWFSYALACPSIMRVFTKRIGFSDTKKQRV